MGSAIRPLLEGRSLSLLRDALVGFTVDGVRARLGHTGAVAQQRGDHAGVSRALRGADDPLATLVRLFLLGEAVPVGAARDALRPLDLDAADALVDRDVDANRVTARWEIRPYGEEDLVVSDLGSDVRPGRLAPDHVLGIGAASTLLAQVTPRRPVDRALDLGTGCGVQALHLSTHARQVVATDVSARALAAAATTAALSGRTWDLRRGSLTRPVEGERFDLVVANPPFVVSPGLGRDSGGFDYRDSGSPGDAVCRDLLHAVPDLLTADGTASMLANWIVPADGDWAGRVAGWLEGGRCDAWVWQREIVDPPAYVQLWLRDAGETPGTEQWTAQYDSWLDWFESRRVIAVGMGLVTLWHAGGSGSVVCDDVPQAVEQPGGVHLPGWIERHRWLARCDDAAVLRSSLRHAADIGLHRHDEPAADGWHTATAQLRQERGLRWEVEIDEAVAGLVAACDGVVPLEVPVRVLAAGLGRSVDEIARAVLPVVRDLVARGFLLPAEAPGRPSELG